MILSNFFNIDAVDNYPGYHSYWFIKDSSVLYIPPQVDGVIDFDKITYAPGKDTWYKGGAIFESINLGEKEKKDANGSLYPINISGKTAGITPTVLNLFHQKRNGRFIVIIADNNGNYFLCGEPNNGILFSYSREAAYFAFTYAGNYTIPCYFLSNYLGSDPTPEPGGGGEGGGIVTIKRADGTIITTATAPAEYTVANTNAVLKDTAGTTISTTSIKPAGAPQEITAPDATINLKDSAGALLDTVTAKSNENKDVVAPNATINLVNTNTDNIGTSSVKSGETKNVAVPDTHVVTKNTLAEIIDDTYVASGSDVEINIGDSTVNIKDSAGALIETKTAPAEKVVETTIPDSSVEITNTLDEVIATVNVKANGSTTQQIDDSNLTLNGAAWTDVPAKSAKDFALVDENGATIPGVGTSTQIQVPLNYNEFEIYFIRQSLINTGNY